jgi:AraC family transcriptional regulator
MERECVVGLMRLSCRYLRPCSVVYIRAIGPYGQSAAAAWAQMRIWAETHNIPQPISRGIGFIRDNPQKTGPFLRRYDACIDIVPGIDIDYHAGVGRQTLPGGTFAVYTHTGEHSQLPDAFAHMKRDAIPARGFTVDDTRAFMEIYLDDPVKVPVAQCRTDLCVPIIASAVADLTGEQSDRLVSAA